MGVYESDNQNPRISNSNRDIMTPANNTYTIGERLKALFRTNPRETTPREYVTVATSNEVTLWNNMLSRRDQHRDEVARAYRTIYRSGGIVRTALDTYNLFMFSGGWTLACDDENEEIKTTIEEILLRRTSDFDEAIQQATLDAISIGDGYCAILKGSGRLANQPVALQHIPAERVKPHINENLQTLWYDLYDTQLMRVLSRLETRDVLHIQLNHCGGWVYGVGIIESAWDDIRHDTEVSEGSAAAIRRHGYGIWHAKVSSTDPDRPVLESDVRAVKDAVQKIGAKTEIVTTANIEIVPLNETGQVNVQNYTDWSVTRLCTALGIPGELLGLRQGSTDATAVSRIENYYKKIQTYQDRLAVAINTQFLDRMLVAMGKPEGSVWIEYADPSPEDNIKRAQYVASIAAMTPDDPFSIMSRQQMQSYLGVDPDEWANDEAYDDTTV